MNEATTNNVGNRSRANVTLGDRKGRPYAEKKFLYYQANAGQSLRLPGREKQVAATFRLRKKKIPMVFNYCLEFRASFGMPLPCG